jgi:Ca2+-binding RTX toxin-like protein
MTEATMAVIQGDEGIDFLIGTPRDDQITGAGSGDFIFGGAGNDIMGGGNGGDFIFGDAGNDTMLGGNGGDLISGGAGNDVMNGGNGDDAIAGEAGNDVMRGGNGPDTFYFGANSGHDLVIDFEPLEGDLIGFLRGAGLDKIVYNPFLDATTIYWAGDNTVTFLHTKKAEVEASFFFPE